MSDLYLGTVAIEPNRWATVDPSRSATITLTQWLDQIEAAGFDGLEVWDKHLTDAPESEVVALLSAAVPVKVFNSYVSFDPVESDERLAAAAWVARSGAAGVKYNVGNDPDLEGAYGERLAEFGAALPDGVRLLCECHEGISIAEDPAVAARIFAAAGGGPALQAICHLGEDPDYLKSKFEHLGDRISHIHINFLADGAAPRLAAIEARVVSQVQLVQSLGFNGTWTLEFAHGLLTANDEPGFILEAAAADLQLLRSLLDD